MSKVSAERLGGTVLSRFMPEEELAKFRECFQEVRYDFGEVIPHAEDTQAVHLLVSGRARVVREKPDGHEITLQRLGPGDVVGEGLFSGNGNGHGAVVVRCSSRVEALRLAQSEFQRLLMRHPLLRQAVEDTWKRRNVEMFLREAPGFAELPAPTLQALLAKLTEARYVRGATVFGPGDVPRIYIIREGKIYVFAGSPGQGSHLGFYREGEIFGGPRSCEATQAVSAQAVTDCQLLMLASEDSEELAVADPAWAHLLKDRTAHTEGGNDQQVPLDFAGLVTSDAGVETTAPAASDADKPEGEEEGTPIFEGGGVKTEGRIRRFPFVWQIDEMDCGAASLAMVCRYFGRKVSLPRIRHLCAVGQDGASLKGICHAATELGLSARPLKISRRHLDLMPLPAVAHWEGNHWLVVYDVDQGSVRVADPALGRRKIPRQEFLDKWSGYTALFDYTVQFEKAPLQHGTLAWVRPFLGPMKVPLLQALGLAALVSALQLLFPILTQLVVDNVMVDRDLHLLNVLLVVMGAAIVFLVLANLIQQYLLSFVTMRVDTSVLDFLTRRLLALPMSYFHQRRTGDIQRRLDAARQIRQFLVQDGIGGLLAAVQVAGCIALMAVYSPLLLGVFLLVLPLYGGLMVFSRRVLRPLFAQTEESEARYSSHQIDAIRGIEAVKAAAAEMTFRDQMLREFLALSKKLLKGNFVTMSYDSLLQAVSLVSTALFLMAGAKLVMSGSMSMGAFVAFGSLMAMASAAVVHMLGIWDELQLVSVLLNRITDIFEHAPEQGTDRSRLLPVRTLAGHIELRRVSFRYGGPDSPDVLQDISLEIAAGQKVAIVGRSGSGKTTLVKLLAGLLEPTAGAIYYDRVDLKTLNYRQLRQQVGLVLQESHLFDESILNNIAFGDPEPDLNRALRAAHVANAHEFVSRLPLGYETRIGETGLGLSSGQKQRIAIARAIYHEPPVLILDEATSSLDSESERAVQANLGPILSKRTCIVIAHRLSTVREADLIVVLDRGRIAETGKHEDLMARRGVYYYLCSQQLGAGS